ncbi:hypothetical protein D1872_309710 [compost metagenome]
MSEPPSVNRYIPARLPSIWLSGSSEIEIVTGAGNGSGPLVVPSFVITAMPKSMIAPPRRTVPVSATFAHSGSNSDAANSRSLIEMNASRDGPSKVCFPTA